MRRRRPFSETKEARPASASVGRREWTLIIVRRSRTRDEAGRSDGVSSYVFFYLSIVYLTIVDLSINLFVIYPTTVYLSIYQLSTELDIIYLSICLTIVCLPTYLSIIYPSIYLMSIFSSICKIVYIFTSVDTLEPNRM